MREYSYCLCCGKRIDTKSDKGWHTSCIRSFFGTDKMPDISLNNEELNRIVTGTVAKKLTVTGVQKKLSLHLSGTKEKRLTLVDYPTGYILKPQTDMYRHLPEFEALTMLMAERCGVKTVPNGLINIGDSYAYITKRIDRHITDGVIEKYAMEDFCQLSDRLTEDKYKGSYEKCAKIIDDYSDTVGFDKTEFFLRLVFCFVTGNSDMHLKNFSLKEDNPGSQQYSLSEAYDLLPVNVVMPEDTEETALTLNGKKNRLKREDFLILAEKIDVPQKVASNIIEKVCSYKDEFINMCKESLLDEEEKETYISLIDVRISRLKRTSE